MSMVRMSDVFVPGGLPRLTYVPRTDRNLEERLSEVNSNLCKLVTVTGATKSGKTVLASRVFPRDKSVWVDGGTVATEDDLWLSILASLGGHTLLESEWGSTSGGELSAEAGGGVGVPLIAQGDARISVAISRQSNRSRKISLSLSARAEAISQLRATRIPLIIDDFHYLDRELQGSVIRALKPLIFEGIPVVLIAIPHRRYDAVRVEREITGRLESIDIPAWETEELLQIPNLGFPLLNVQLAPEVAERLATEAYGSPHLMQEFCRQVARDHGITETLAQPMIISQIDDSLFRRVADSTGKVIYEKLATGPRQRSDRKKRPLRSGAEVDIYQVVLLALTKLSPGLATIQYEQLRAAIRDILKDAVPQAHEVTRVLEKMTEIAMSDEASTPVLDWDRDDQKLHITDPFFAFYLKWGSHAI